MNHKLFHRFTGLIFALVISFTGFNPVLAAPPLNDDFANAETIPSLPFTTTVDITDTSAEPGEPQNCAFPQQTVWYSFTPTETMSVRVDAQGGTVNGIVEIYRSTGGGIADLQFLSCVVNFGSSSTFLAEAGQAYFLRASPNGGNGTVQINLQQVFPPANDIFANAEVIGSLPFTTTVDITDTGFESGEPSGCTGSQQTVWYSFTPTETMSVRVDAQGGTVNGIVEIYRSTGSGIADLQFLSCVSSFGSARTFLAEAGQVYYLKATPNGGNGTVQINLRQVFPPANDIFANAEVVGSLPFSATADITDTSAEPGEPQNCAFPQQTVWYSFTPTETMSVRVDTNGGAVNGIVEIYRSTGGGIADLQFLSCVANFGSSSTFLAEAGQAYFLRASPNGGNGTVQINLQRVFPPANDIFANAEVVNSLPFSATADITDTGIEPDEPRNCSFSQQTVWYSFTPTDTMSIRVDTNGGSVNGIVEIYRATGSGFANLQFLNCASGFGSTTTFLAEGGQVYYLKATPNGGNGSIQINLQQVFPPANDIFANAEVIGSLPFNATVDITDAGVEPGEPQNCSFMNRTVWYSFTPIETMSIRASTSGSMNIYRATGNGISNLQHMQCIDPVNSSSPFLVEAGQVYYIQAGPFFGISNGIQVNLQQAFPPTNDIFANAEAITSLPFNATPDITDAGIEPSEPQFCRSMNKTIWYSFTPSETMNVRASSQATMNIYRAAGTGVSNLQHMQCIDAGSIATFVAEAGQVYYLQVGFDFGFGGIIQVNLQQSIPPANDIFVNPESITSLPFSATVDITDASIESNEPQFCYFMGRTIWYSFIPTESMLLRASTLGSSISGNVNIYQATGDGFSNLQHLQCSGPGGSPTFQVEANQTYYLQVGPAFGEVGTVHLNLERVIPPANDNFANPETIAGIPFSTSVNITDAQIESNEPQFCYFMGRTVWYSFIPTEAMSLKADTFGSSINGNVNVYSSTGADFSNLQFMQCSGPSNSPIFQVEAGQTYYLQAGPAFGEVGTIQVNLQRVAAITGRITDSITGVPLPGDGSPFTSITLRRCDEFGCNEFVNQQQADSNGQFRFSTYYFGSPLPTGTYQIEITAALYQTSQVGSLGFVEGQDLNLGDVPLTPVPLIGSISGRLLDSVTGKPISADFQPLLQLYNCNEFGCSFMNSQTPDSAGRYRFETDFNSNRLPAGTYQVVAFADQYEQGQTNPFDVGENINRAVNLRLKSFPVRFSEIQPCVDIPAAGGECIYSVKVTNGSRGTFKGSAWSVVDSSLPDSFTGFTNFQTREPQEISIDQGKSKVLQFKFRVPANNSTFGTYICPQAFVGQGKGLLFNTVGQRGLFCVYRNAGGFTILSPEELQDTLQQSRDIQANTLLLTANGTDIEPNNMCATAQDFGEVTLPYTVEGGLDSTQSPDVDFFRFSGTPNSLVVIDLEGAPTGKGTLGDSVLGFFDSNCNPTAVDDDSGESVNSRLEVAIPSDGVFILAASQYPDFSFTSGGTGTYQLTISPIQYIGSISGRATDASTGNPLPGDTTPFTFVSLRRCEAFGCFEVNTQSAGSDGRFNFTGNFNGEPLRTGTYQIVIFADQYQTGDFGQFFVGDSEIRDLGDMPLQSYPVRFSDIQACTVSSTGGVCEFSVKVTNGMSAMLSGKTWSIVDGFNIGSFTNYTRFQTSDPQNINLLGPGKSKVLRFSFRIPAGVADGATICAQVFVGEGTNAFFNTNGHRHLFCFSKGTSGFTLMSEQEAQAAFRELETQDLVLPDLLEENKK